MELKDKTIDELMERRAAIAEEVEQPEADLDALEEEARAIKEELENRKNAEAKKAEIRASVAKGEGEVVAKVEKEERKEMTEKEIRNSAEYINAFANYIKSGDDKECRALLTQNVEGGMVPVPEYVEGRIRTAWEKNGLLSLIRKTYVKGILKVGFEVSATGAVIHGEGQEAITDEELVLGVASLVPYSIKKMLHLSDEVLDLTGSDFLDFIYDELAYQIGKKLEDEIIGYITSAPTASDSSDVGVPAIAGAPSDLSIIALAIANLGDQASNITVVMNRLTYADFVAAMVAANYKYDPFEGINVVFNNTLPAYANADTDERWLIVGDFAGVQANFPNGDEIKIKFDDLSEAEADLVKIVGRMYVGFALTTPGALSVVYKGE